MGTFRKVYILPVAGRNVDRDDTPWCEIEHIIDGEGTFDDPEWNWSGIL